MPSWFLVKIQPYDSKDCSLQEKENRSTELLDMNTEPYQELLDTNTELYQDPAQII
jgi:hypothetical protein